MPARCSLAVVSCGRADGTLLGRAGGWHRGQGSEAERHSRHDVPRVRPPSVLLSREIALGFHRVTSPTSCRARFRAWGARAVGLVRQHALLCAPVRLSPGDCALTNCVLASCCGPSQQGVFCALRGACNGRVSEARGTIVHSAHGLCVPQTKNGAFEMRPGGGVLTLSCPPQQC